MIALLAAPTFIDSLLLRFFSEQTVNYVIWPLIQVGAVVTITALWVAYATYLERKISAFIQARLGPMRVGPWGLLQPIADGLKLLVKEDFIPENADRWIFFIAPYIAVVAAFVVDRKSTRLNSSHRTISYAVFCLKKKRISDMALLILAILQRIFI